MSGFPEFKEEVYVEPEEIYKIDKIGLEIIDRPKDILDLKQEELFIQLKFAIDSMPFEENIEYLRHVDALMSCIHTDIDQMIIETDFVNRISAFLDTSSSEVVNLVISILTNLSVNTDLDLPEELAHAIVDFLPEEKYFLSTVRFIMGYICSKSYAPDCFITNFHLLNCIISMIYRDIKWEWRSCLLQICSQLSRRASMEVFDREIANPDYFKMLLYHLKSKREEVLSIVLRCVGFIFKRSKNDISQLINDSVPLFLEILRNPADVDKEGLCRIALCDIFEELLNRLAISDNEYKRSIIEGMLNSFFLPNNPDDEFAKLIEIFCDVDKSREYYEMIKGSDKFKSILSDISQCSFNMKQSFLLIFAKMLIADTRGTILWASASFRDLFNEFFEILPETNEFLRFAILNAIRCVISDDISNREFVDKDTFIEVMESLQDIDNATDELVNIILELVNQEVDEEDMIDILPF